MECSDLHEFRNLVIYSMYNIVMFTVSNSDLDHYGLSNVQEVASVFHTTFLK